MRPTTIFVLFLFLAVPAPAQQFPETKVDFDLIDVDARLNVLTTTHAAKYRIGLANSFKFLGELHHQAVYNDRGFDISMAVFSRGDDLLLIHAEKHTDGSGGLDYSHLEPAMLKDIPFTRRTQCATEEDEEELNSNPQISYIRSKGFEFKLPFQLEQYFTTSRDGTSEIVISYGRAVNECSDSFGLDMRTELEKVVWLRELELDPDSDYFYLRSEVPAKGDCEIRVGPRGLASEAETCSFDKFLDRASKVNISRTKAGKGWEKVVIKTDSGDSAVLYLSVAKGARSLFDVFFTKTYYEFQKAPHCTGLATSLDVLGRIGFPSVRYREGDRERWIYDHDRPNHCAEYTEILIENSEVKEVAVTL